MFPSLMLGILVLSTEIGEKMFPLFFPLVPRLSSLSGSPVEACSRRSQEHQGTEREGNKSDS